MRNKETKIVELEIKDLTDLGEGWAYLPAEQNPERKIFIPFTCPNEKAQVEITQENKKFARGRLVEVLEENKDVRIEPRCPYFQKCGGCTLQHISEDLYYQTKLKLLENTLKRISFSKEEESKISQNIKIRKTGYNSRRRVNFKVGGDVLGFYKFNTNDLISIDECCILEKKLENLIIPLKQFLRQNNKKKTIAGIRASLVENGIDLVFEIDKKLDLKLAEQLKNLTKSINDIVSIKYSINNKTYPLFKKENPYIDIKGVNIELPTDYFLQASIKGQNHIVSEVLQSLQNLKIKKVVDLYSGVGTYSFPIAKKLDFEVAAIEGSDEMTNSVKKNAVSNGLQHKVFAQTRDLFNQPLQPEELNKFDAVVINPPRNGAGTQAVNLAKSDVKTVVMVSCNPSSFLRDARALKEGGYKITSLIGVDQFYMSSHLEIVARFER